MKSIWVRCSRRCRRAGSAHRFVYVADGGNADRLDLLVFNAFDKESYSV
jgi:uncharacterized membrane protein